MKLQLKSMGKGGHPWGGTSVGVFCFATLLLQCWNICTCANEIYLGQQGPCAKALHVCVLFYTSDSIMSLLAHQLWQVSVKDLRDPVKLLWAFLNPAFTQFVGLHISSKPMNITSYWTLNHLSQMWHEMSVSLAPPKFWHRTDISFSCVNIQSACRLNVRTYA